MSQKTQRMRRWRLVPLAIALTLAVVAAAPAAAKGPVFYPYACGPGASQAGKAPADLRTQCEQHPTARNGQGLSGGEAGIAAGIVGVLVLMIAGGMLVATHRRDAPGRRPATQT